MKEIIFKLIGLIAKDGVITGNKEDGVFYKPLNDLQGKKFLKDLALNLYAQLIIKLRFLSDSHEISFNIGQDAEILTTYHSRRYYRIEYSESSDTKLLELKDGITKYHLLLNSDQITMLKKENFEQETDKFIAKLKLSENHNSEKKIVEVKSEKDIPKLANNTEKIEKQKQQECLKEKNEIFKQISDLQNQKKDFPTSTDIDQKNRAAINSMILALNIDLLGLYKKMRGLDMEVKDQEFFDVYQEMLAHYITLNPNSHCTGTLSEAKSHIRDENKYSELVLYYVTTATTLLFMKFSSEKDYVHFNAALTIYTENRKYFDANTNQALATLFAQVFSSNIHHINFSYEDFSDKFWKFYNNCKDKLELKNKIEVIKIFIFKSLIELTVKERRNQDPNKIINKSFQEISTYIETLVDPQKPGIIFKKTPPSDTLLQLRQVYQEISIDILPKIQEESKVPQLS